MPLDDGSLFHLRPGYTPAEVRRRIAQLCTKAGYDPVRELLSFVKEAARPLRDELLDIADTIENEPEIDTDEICPRLRHLASLIQAPNHSEIISIHKELLQYVAPKLRGVDISGEVKQDITVNIKHFQDEVKTINVTAKEDTDESD